MHVHINLASQKFEDVRQFFIRWSAALAILSALTIGLGILAYLKYDGAARAAVQTRDLQQKIDALKKERDTRMIDDNRPENREVTQQRKFWNSQISRRSFSWTQLLNDMQKIMPRRAYLESVQPELTLDNRLKLRLVIIGDNQDKARELVEKMESSKLFHSTKIVTGAVQRETRPGAGSTYRLEVETFYTPVAMPLPSPPAQNQRSLGRSASDRTKETT